LILQLSPTHMGLWPCDQTATGSPGLPFNGLHPVIDVITWNTTHLPPAP